MKLAVIAEGLVKNHGYWQAERDGYSEAYVSCDSGVYRVTPPAQRGGDWAVEIILERPVSDIALCDLDGDGEEELATIEEFHGGRYVINKKIDGVYKEVYSHLSPDDFCHAIWGGKLRGVPTFIGGCRAGSRELFYVQLVDGEYVTRVIETGTGSSNVAVIHEGERDIIVAANHGIGEGALYICED